MTVTCNRNVSDNSAKYHHAETHAVGDVLIFACWVAVALSCHGAWAQGNKVSFANGGTLAAEVVTGNGAEALANVTTPEGVIIVVPADQVKRQTGMRKEVLAYRATAPLLPDTPQAHLVMARKCMENNLSAQADRHLEHVLELDPENEETHKLLHHVKVNGEWISPKERMEQKGYTRYNGKLLTNQEIELEKKRLEFRQTQNAWRKQVKTLLKDFTDHKIGMEEFRHIKDPAALGSLSEAYGKERKEAVRLAIVTAIGSIGSVAALSELGAVSLKDDVEEIRLTALDAIKRRPEAITGAIEYYKKFLLSDNPIQVNRAAAMLGVLAPKDAIPALINSLVTSHTRTITVGSNQTSASFRDGRLQGFSPGGGQSQKTVVETVQNEQVLIALRRIVSVYYGTVPQYRFEEEQWRQWYRSVNSIDNFSSRRTP
ncbi:MAG: hypothetical protein PHQ75_00160 [Thermoguttaceae bacterium]|nr:hypothetical protein [Thermoguttaceae bacterium]